MGVVKSISCLLLLFVVFSEHDNVCAKSELHNLNESNWSLMLEGEWMVDFFAPWCPACKGLQPIWKDFASWSDDLNIKVAEVDITTSPGLSGRFVVTALPTIFHVINGEFRQYRGPRDKSAFMSYIEDKKWMQTDPVPGWKNPSSIQMSIVANFFKMSNILRGFHNTLMEEYGVPTWGSYVTFAVATIIVGALLGLVAVCIIDCVYPPRVSGKEVELKLLDKVDDSSEEEVSKEDLIDDKLDPEKNSGSDTDSAESPATKTPEDKSPANSQKNSPNNSPSRSPAEVRKRKPRKAD